MISSLDSPIVIALFVVLGTVLGCIALRRTAELQRQLTGLEREVASLHRTLAAKPVGPEAPPAAQAGTAEPAIAAAASSSPETKMDGPAPAAHIATATMAPTPTPGGRSLERNLTGRWTVWLGALAVALSGVFLVKYSIERDLLGPGVRVGFGLLLGTVLVGGGLWLHLSPQHRAPPAKMDYVAPSLAAAGIAALFATVYAAFALYSFLPPLVAFAAMAAIAALAVMLSLLLGPFIAGLGLAGAFLVPLLVPSNEPSAWGLFAYLLIVAVACLALVRYKGWWWLTWASLGFSALWTLLWFATTWHTSDTAALGAYFVLLTASVVGLTRGIAVPTQPDRLVWGTAIFAALATLCLTVAAINSAMSVVVAFALILLLFAVGRRYPALERLPWLGAGTALAIFAIWGLDDRILFRALDGLARFGHPPIVPEQASAFSWTAALFALLFGGGGYGAQWGAQRPGRWAGMAAATTVSLLCIAYWRLDQLASGLSWTVLALALAAANLAAAWHSARYRDHPGMEGALAAYAVGVVASTTFAATMNLRFAWMSVALAVQLPAIAWVAEETRVIILRRVAFVLAASVLVRLLLNPDIVNYPLGGGLFLNWLLYGYGIPCGAFFLAAHLFRRAVDDFLVMVLEAGGVALGLALVSLEIHQLLGDGTLASRTYDIFEGGLQVDSWLAVAMILLYRCRSGARPVYLWGWRIVGGAVLVHLVVFQLLIGNPLLTGKPVGTQPIFNDLLVAYAVPAVLAALFHREARRQGESLAAAIAGIGGLFLGFLALSLELRQWFHGSDLRAGTLSDPEAYSYSLAWLLYGGVLLGFGIRSDEGALRLAGLGVLTVTVAKTFLFDMSNLTGLYRAGSFLALGLCLIGIGYLYQRVVFPPPAGTTSGA